MLNIFKKDKKEKVLKDTPKIKPNKKAVSIGNMQVKVTPMKIEKVQEIDTNTVHIDKEYANVILQDISNGVTIEMLEDEICINGYRFKTVVGEETLVLGDRIG